MMMYLRFYKFWLKGRAYFQPVLRMSEQSRAARRYFETQREAENYGKRLAGRYMRLVEKQNNKIASLRS